MTAGGSAHPLRRRALRSVVVGLASCLVASLGCADPLAKPRVPVGVDPGGVLVAMIGDGIDYTMPEITRRLARDGEGELIGWDFVDGDRRPYGASTNDADRKPGHATATAAAVVMVKDNVLSRLAIFRVASDALTLPPEAGPAVDFATKAQAKVITIGSLIAGRVPLSIAAAKRYPGVLFLVGVEAVPNGGWDELARLDNALSVRDAVSACGEAAVADAGVSSPLADIAVPVDCVPFGGDRVPSADFAVARVAALSARILADTPALTAAELKQRVIAFAKPFPAGSITTTRFGWIETPTPALQGAR